MLGDGTCDFRVRFVPCSVTVPYKHRCCIKRYEQNRLSYRRITDLYVRAPTGLTGPPSNMSSHPHPEASSTYRNKKINTKRKNKTMSKRLNILWTNPDVGTAHNMVFMYATNSKLNDWWEEVNLIIWGATAPLVATDKTIQDRIKMAQHAGVTIEACQACASQYGVIDDLKALGITVRGMGKPLTEILKSDEKLLTI